MGFDRDTSRTVAQADTAPTWKGPYKGTLLVTAVETKVESAKLPAVSKEPVAALNWAREFIRVLESVAAGSTLSARVEEIDWRFVGPDVPLAFLLPAENKAEANAFKDAFQQARGRKLPVKVTEEEVTVAITSTRAQPLQ
jgi:hypothetical protein